MADGEDPTSGLSDAQIAADLAFLQQKIADGKILNELERERLELLDMQQERRLADVGNLKDALKEQQAILANQRAAALGEENKYAKMQLQLQVKETMKEVEKAEIALIQRKLQYGKDLTKEEKARLAGLEDITDELAKQEEAMKAIVAKGSELGKKMAVYGQHAQLNVGKIAELGKAIAEGPLAFTDGLFQGAIIGIIDTIINLALQVDIMESKFRQATGASAAFARDLTAVYEETREYGVTTEEAIAANTALFGSFTNFSLILPGARKQVAATTQILGEFGVGAGDVATGMQTATKSFGQTAEQAAQSALEINALAQDLGVIPQQMAQDYATVGTQLSKLGDQGTKAFKDLALVSKITGMEMQKLLTITDKFDTFEGAAEQTGKLNAALGGNFVNAMDLMMETDPATRFNMIRDSIKDAGLSFDSMSYYQRKYFAEAAGLDSVSDLAMMLSGNYDDLGGEMGKTSAQYADQAEKAKEMKDLMEKLKITLQKMIPIAHEVIDWLRDFVDNIDENIKSIKHWGVVALKTYAAIKGFLIFGKILGFLTSTTLQFGLLSAAQATQAAVQTGSNAAMAPTGPIAAEAGAGLGVFALAALGVGVAIAIAAVGMAQFVKAFGALEGGWEILAAGAAVGIFATALWFLIPAIAGLVPTLAAVAAPTSWAGVIILGLLAAAAMAVGFAIKMAGDSLAGLIDSIAALAATNSPFTDLVDGLRDIRKEVNAIHKDKAKALTKLMKRAQKGDVDLPATLAIRQVNTTATEALETATTNRTLISYMEPVPGARPLWETTESGHAQPTGGYVPAQNRGGALPETILVQLDAAATRTFLEGGLGRAAVGSVNPGAGQQ